MVHFDTIGSRPACLLASAASVINTANYAAIQAAGCIVGRRNPECLSSEQRVQQAVALHQSAEMAISARTRTWSKISAARVKPTTAAHLADD